MSPCQTYSHTQTVKKNLVSRSEQQSYEGGDRCTGLELQKMGLEGSRRAHRLLCSSSKWGKAIRTAQDSGYNPYYVCEAIWTRQTRTTWWQMCFHCSIQSKNTPPETTKQQQNLYRIYSTNRQWQENNSHNTQNQSTNLGVQGWADKNSTVSRELLY